ncbi:MAG: MFS transporter [Oligoflexia bacterium]|nr:MFS transporter [Oligoflexia bacterium]
MSHKKVLNKTVVSLGIVSLLADISSEMLYPITPIFLTTVLGASMTSLGIIEGFAEGVLAILKSYSGVISDRIGKRKPFIWIGYLFAAFAKPLIGSAETWVQVLFARGFDRVGKGLRTSPRDALLADSVSIEHRGLAFGWHRAMDTLGAAIGPLLAIFFLSLNPSSLRTIYYWALLPGLAAVLLIYFVPEKENNNKAALPPPVKWRWSELPKDYKKYVITWGVFSLTNSSDAFLLMKTQQSGVSLTNTILMYCFYNLVFSLTSPFMGGLSDKYGRRKVLRFGLLVFAAVYFGFAFAKDTYVFWILFATYGLYFAATDGVGKALAVDLVGPHMHATSLGIFGTVSSLATIVASTLAGILWDQFGASAAFAYGATGALIAAALLFLLFSETKSTQKSTKV